MYIPNFIEIGQTFCGRTYGRTDISPSNVKSTPKKLSQFSFKTKGNTPVAG